MTTLPVLTTSLRRTTLLVALAGGALACLASVPTFAFQDTGAGAAGAADEKTEKTEKTETGTEYWFGTSVARTNILFESETDLETIHGVTHVMSGTARLDHEAGTGSCSLEVPVAELRTGMDARDEHLRGEKWLDAEKHPDIVFETKKLKVKDARKGLWTYEGTLTIKGTSKDLAGEAVVKVIPAAAGKRLGPGEWVKVKTEFQVALADFGVEVPEHSAAKVSGTIDIRVDIFGTTHEPKKPAR